jgi:hypothetical protein
MSNQSIIPMFVIFFVLAFGLGLGLSDTFIGQDDIEQAFRDRFETDFDDEVPANWFNLIFDNLLSVEVGAGLIAGGALGFLVGGTGMFIVTGIVMGGVIGYIFNYFAIFNMFIRVLPSEMSIFFVGFFSMVIIGWLVRILVTR